MPNPSPPRRRDPEVRNEQRDIITELLRKVAEHRASLEAKAVKYIDPETGRLVHVKIAKPWQDVPELPGRDFIGQPTSEFVQSVSRQMAPLPDEMQPTTLDEILAFLGRLPAAFAKKFSLAQKKEAPQRPGLQKLLAGPSELQGTYWQSYDPTKPNYRPPDEDDAQVPGTQ